MAFASTPALMSGFLRRDRMPGVCQIVRFVCLFGFALNMLVLFLLPQLGDAMLKTGVASVINLLAIELGLVGLVDMRYLFVSGN